MKFPYPNLPLRIIVCVILFMHSIPAMINGGVNDFGNFYLNPLGFGSLGVAAAWTIKLSHVAMMASLLIDKWVKPLGYVTILILLTGIILVHAPNGWYVVGAGTNGAEFNLLLIGAMITIMYPRLFQKTAG